ncbi:2OG-Fe(II) oxygenase [Parvicella tangerina]|uniref:Fe2OG dioxygenase domain-containing protein n=1 Tax=Parvicella tangerina TaxID=2829795 RepID=A0A916NBX5_9FLAO|nr:2OG-Fe(II) oxygenase [Parvicella tangerina]CAG5084031.1 hypothetical protein CRYO30217_02357 [Parvicella tangerina]
MNINIEWDQYFEEMATQEFTVVDNFLPTALYEHLQAQFKTYLKQDQLEPAGIGSLTTYQINENIRTDEILWLERNDCTPEVASYFAFIENDLIPQLNRNLFLSIKDFEFMLAYYPPGGFYKRHLDQFKERNNRLLSMVIYMNDNWQKGDGGELEIFHNNSEATTIVEPIGNRLVLFNSATVWHQVLPAQKERKSVTGWLLKMPQGLGFLG